MTSPDEPSMDAFNTWLEDIVAGRSPGLADDPELAAIEVSVLQMRATTARERSHLRKHGALAARWEDQMRARVSDLVPMEQNRPGNGPLLRAIHRWQSAVSLAVVVAVLVGLVGVSWYRGFGGPVAPESPLGAAIASPALEELDLPTAEDCTVEPLTVDQVISIVRNPLAAFYSSDSQGSATPRLGATPSTPDSWLPGTTRPPVKIPTFQAGPATPGTLALAATTLHMHESCMLADNYFAVWATMSPFTVAADILDILPPLTSEVELRTALDTLWVNGPDTGTSIGRDAIGFPSFFQQASSSHSDSLRVLDQNPANSWQPTAGSLVASYGLYRSDGSLFATVGSIFIDDMGTPVAPTSRRVTEPSCGRFIFTYSDARKSWLVESNAECAEG